MLRRRARARSKQLCRLLQFPPCAASSLATCTATYLPPSPNADGAAFRGYAAQNVVFSVWPDVYLKLRKVRAPRWQACAFPAAQSRQAARATLGRVACGALEMCMTPGTLPVVQRTNVYAVQITVGTECVSPHCNLVYMLGLTRAPFAFRSIQVFENEADKCASSDASASWLACLTASLLLRAQVHTNPLKFYKPNLFIEAKDRVLGGHIGLSTKNNEVSCAWRKRVCDGGPRSRSGFFQQQIRRRTMCRGCSSACLRCTTTALTLHMRASSSSPLLVCPPPLRAIRSPSTRRSSWRTCLLRRKSRCR